MSDLDHSLRADPDVLLSAIMKKRDRKKGGKFHLFIGMAPGVGKTYAMLLSGREALCSGLDIVVGVVETHGRKETEQLLHGLEIIPKKKLIHRDIEFYEMDIDAILKRRPHIVLVDELAHTNVPGSRHSKRWQDVIELLDAGINVYSTINVQHFESRKEAVERIASVTISETVPDSVLDRAFQIRLIDLSVPDLLQRLKEGKVYVEDKAELAAAHFFKEEKLTALREIALRVAAERVDTELQAFATEKEAGSQWAAAERLMVAVGFSPTSETLIRTTRKMAYNLDASWIALHISSNKLSSESEKVLLKKNLDLARNLGAEIITVADTNIVDGIIRVAKQKDITQIIVGRSKQRWFRNLFGQRCIHDQLIEKCTVDIVVVGEKPKKKVTILAKLQSIKIHSTPTSIVKAILYSVSMLLTNALLASFIGYRAVGFLLLLSILIIGLFLPIASVLLASLLMVIGWNIFFIPPIGSIYVKEPEDLFLCIAFVIAGLATGILTRRIRFQQDILTRRELRVQALNQILLDIATATTTRTLHTSALKHIGIFLHGECDFILRKKDNSTSLFIGKTLQFTNESRELAVAKWTMDNNKAAGRFTETLSSAEALYIPLRGSFEMMGALAYRAHDASSLSLEDVDFLFTVARQLAIHLENQKFRHRALESERLSDSEKFHRALLEVLVREIKASSSDDKLDARLAFTMDNFLLASRLVSGIYPLRRELASPSELVDKAVNKACALIPGELAIKINAQKNLSRINVEQESIIQSLANIVLNAAEHAGGTEITIDIFAETIIVSDQGPGLDEEDLGRSFEKFTVAKDRNAQGFGLGLAIAKGIVKAHRGKITLENRPPKGLTVIISLPTT